MLNADDSFYKLHRTIALKKNLKVISFSIKNKKSNILFKNIIKKGLSIFQLILNIII